MAISDKLQELLDIKQDIKVAIENKGVALTGVEFGGYANKILDISGGGGMTYEDYARTLYLAWGKSNQFATAWEHSLIVDPLEISASGSPMRSRGKEQYPNGETEGVIIPNGVTSIGQFAFAGWVSNNQPLVIPNSVTSIGVQAFAAWLSNDQPLVIPDSVTSIGQFAFTTWDANDQPLVIPNSVTSIGVQAFSYWSSAKEFIMESETPPTITSDSFQSTNNAPIYVPNASVDAYKTATNWVDLADRIFSINDK